MKAHRSLFAAFQAASVELWGHDGTAQCLRHLSRGALDRSVLISEDWLPERYTLEWMFAAWNGPAARVSHAYRDWLRCVAKLQVGMARPLLWLAGPTRILAHAPALWRRHHSRGELDVQLTEGDATLTLREHPWANEPLAYVALAELYRYALRRVGTVEVSRIATDPATLTFKLSWART